MASLQALSGRAIWTGGVIPCVIDAGLPEPQRFLEAIQHCNENTVIQLVERTNEPNWVRLRGGR